MALTVGRSRVQAFTMTAPATRSSRMASRANPARRFPAPADDAAHLVMRHKLDDYALDESKLSTIAGAKEYLKAFVPLSDLYHYRLQVLRSFERGDHEFCAFTEGFFIVFGDVEVDTPQSEYVSCPDTLQVSITSDYDGECFFPDGDALRMAGPSAAIVIQPPGAPAAEVAYTGRHRYVGVSIHRDALSRLYAGGEHQLPIEIQELLAGTLQKTIARSLPAATLLRCLEDVHGCGLDGLRRRLFLQSKAVEILCQAIDALEHSGGFSSPETTIWMARGVLKAQGLLAEDFVSPPSLDDLAHEVGLSRTGLCTGFRRILGQSVSDFVQGLRMQHALKLLSDRDVPIARIGYAVGYNRASSFTVAVQRHFGVTPTELRRRSLARTNSPGSTQ